MQFWFFKWFFVVCTLTVFAEPSFYHVGRLPNGLQYYIHQDPSFRKHISMDLVVRAGAINEQKDEGGFAHLVEHLVASDMAFKGIKIDSEYCPLWDLSNPDVSELTSYEFTQYHLDVSRAISHGLEEGLKSFASALTTLTITPETLREQQRDIIEEIAETERSAIKKWQRKRIDYEYQPYRDKHPLGNALCIQEATIEKVDRFFLRYYQPSRCAIIVIGNMDIDLTTELIKDLKNQIQHAALSKWFAVDDLRDFYRDLFVKQDASFHPYLDASSFETITFERFLRIVPTFQSFSQASLITNQPVSGYDH